MKTIRGVMVAVAFLVVLLGGVANTAQAQVKGFNMPLFDVFDPYSARTTGEMLNQAPGRCALEVTPSLARAGIGYTFTALQAGEVIAPYGRIPVALDAMSASKGCDLTIDLAFKRYTDQDVIPTGNAYWNWTPAIEARLRQRFLELLQRLGPYITPGNSKYHPNLVIWVAPCLEDRFTDAGAVSAAQAIDRWIRTENFGPGVPSAAMRTAAMRPKIVAEGSLHNNSSFRNTIAGLRGQVEYHGPLSNAVSGAAFSNDGSHVYSEVVRGFVYYDTASNRLVNNGSAAEDNQTFGTAGGQMTLRQLRDLRGPAEVTCWMDEFNLTVQQQWTNTVGYVPKLRVQTVNGVPEARYPLETGLMTRDRGTVLTPSVQSKMRAFLGLP